MSKIMHIFIDTSFFEENNFFKGKLNRLYQYAKDGYVELYTNELVIREVKSRIENKMSIAKSNAIKLFNNQESYILGNCSYANIIRDFKSKDYYAKETKRLCSEFNSTIKETPFVIIPYDDIDFAKIIEDYFQMNSPFKEGKKKNEFPDAFILSSIDSYCLKKRVKIIAISNDNDWLSYRTDKFEICNDIDTIFESLAKKQKEKESITFVTQLISSNKEYILSQIEEYIIENAYFENTDYFDSEITNYSINNCELQSEIVTYINDRSAEIIVEIAFTISADITFPDYENAGWDNEDKVYLFLENITKNHNFEVKTEVLVLVEYDLENVEFYELNIKSINNGNSIELTIDDWD
jgi:hypothetical protein